MAGGAPAGALLRRMEHSGSRLDFLRLWTLRLPPGIIGLRPASAGPRLLSMGGKILLDKSTFDMVFCVCSGR